MTPEIRHWLTLAALAWAATDAFGLELEACRLSSPWLPAVTAECGELEVPEDPADSAGRNLRLFVARIPSHNAAPRPDPLVLIAGGPGQAATDFYLTVRGAFEHVRRDRDLIVLDQRGTGRSAPLECAIAAEALETAAPESLPGLMTRCLEDLDADPRFYTTSVAVQDLERVRAALGIEAWNLYGISYGTRVAQHFIRRFPQRVRAVILDGVVPSDLAMGPAIAANAQRALELLLSRCSQEAACAERFPGLADRLGGLSRRLSAGPITIDLADPLTGEVGRRTFSALHLKSVIRLMSYAPQTVALLPLLITEAHEGNFAPLTAQAYMMIAALERSLSLPMHNSVVCTEDVPFFSASPRGTEATYLGRSIVEALEAVCSVWPPGVRDPDLKAPLESDRPVLLLSGEADPVTPPAYGFRVIAHLGSARHIVGPGQGHGLAGVGCVPRLLRDFLSAADPAGVAAACVRQEQPSPFFLDFTGPAP
jgi:pimeloyl-ACP methyl ester carboxylesterase